MQRVRYNRLNLALAHTALIIYTITMIVITGIHPFQFAMMVRRRASEFMAD